MGHLLPPAYHATRSSRSRRVHSSSLRGPPTGCGLVHTRLRSAGSSCTARLESVSPCSVARIIGTWQAPGAPPDPCRSAPPAGRSIRRSLSATTLSSSPGRRSPSVSSVPVAGDGQASRTNQTSVGSSRLGRGSRPLGGALSRDGLSNWKVPRNLRVSEVDMVPIVEIAERKRPEPESLRVDVADDRDCFSPDRYGR